MARIVLILAVIHSLFLLSHARYSIDPRGESNSSIKTLWSNETDSILLDPKESTGIEPIDLTAEEGATDSAVIDQDRHGDEGPPLDEIPISAGEATGWVSKEEEEGEGKEQMEEKNKKVEDSDSDSDDEEEEEEERKGGFVKWFLNLVNRF